MKFYHALTRVDVTYAWGECFAPRTPDRINPSPTCGNTVKFGADQTTAVCPACGARYRCTGKVFTAEE